MSVCLHLWDVRNDIDFTGDYLDELFDTIEDLERNGKILYAAMREHGAPMDEDGNITDYEAFNDWDDEQKKLTWSDHNIHERFDFNYNKALLGPKAWKKVKPELYKFGPKKYTSKMLGTVKYLTLDEKLYRQGWFFKKKFFKLKHTSVICFTRKDMNDFFDKYLQFKESNAQEVYEAFNANWHDGLIFECSW